MLPVAVLIAVGWAASGWWRGLYAWLTAIIGVLGTMAVLKYIFFACAGPLGQYGIASPSGHTAASTAIYGGALVLVLRDRVPWFALAATPLAFGTIFGISRLVLGAHDLLEVLLGGAIGLTGVALLVVLAGPRPPVKVWPVCVSVGAIIILLHGFRFPGESLIHTFPLFTWWPLPAVCRA